jgi:CubicO group peptidase (beta-lactamase class C family)
VSEEAKTFKTLDEVVEHYRQKAQVPGLTVGTLIDGDFRGSGYGVISLETNYPTRVDTLFQIGSNTKVMTATVVMQLVEQGKLHLDTPIVEYLPELELSDKDAQEAITMRHLLTHQSGIDGDIFDDTGVGDDALKTLIAKAKDWKQDTKPGEQWSYCNSGFYIAGRILEVTLGQSYETIMNERLFAPLGMDRSFWFAQDAIYYSAAAGHQQLPGQEHPTLAKPWPIPRNAAAAGAAISSVEDVLRFMHFHMSGGKTAEGVISAESVAAMQEPQRRVTSQFEWGIGWTLGMVDGHRVLYHGGTTNGQNSQMYAVPDKNFAISILTNSGKGSEAIGPIIDWALERYCGLKREKPQPVEMSTTDLERYAGTYRRDIGVTIVSVEDKKLKLETTMTHPLTHEEIAFPAEYIVPIGNDEFIGAEEDEGDAITQFIGDVGGHPRFIRSGYRLVQRV